jgi:glycosyltransferase involved in cell wall biosynthesis
MKPGAVWLQRRMVERDPIATAPPLFSIIIAVYNDWAPLDQCLQSLAQQTSGASFEAIIVDDGSSEPAPEFIRQWIECYPLTIIRHPHAGISAARNRGVRISRGAVLVFVDADCRFQAYCLAALCSTIAEFPLQNYLQLHLVGDCSGGVGRAEELRLATLQNHLIQPDGHIRYLNTAGFAMRRATVDMARGVFDPLAIRAEDTLLLATLMERGELPLFVANATVQHAIPLSLMECLRKDIRSVYLERKAYDIIASKGVRIQLSHRERLMMLWSMWKISGGESIGRSRWFVVTGRQTLRLFAFFVYRCFRGIRLSSSKT